MQTAAAGAATTEHEVRSNRFLTVCGDPNNLPFSNKAGDGFENRIAQLIAEALDRPLRYRWWPQTIGFVRNTLQLRACDLVLGISSVNELVQNTNPYYRSVYTVVSRRDRNLDIATIDDPRLADLELGVVAGTPPATVLAQKGLMANTRPFLRTVDTRHFTPARDALQAVADGELDLAFIWGPIAGYYANRLSQPLRVTPLPAELDQVPMAFSVTMGIRHRETACTTGSLKSHF